MLFFLKIAESLGESFLFALSSKADFSAKGGSGGLGHIRGPGWEWWAWEFHRLLSEAIFFKIERTRTKIWTELVFNTIK